MGSKSSIDMAMVEIVVANWDKALVVKGGYGREIEGPR